MRLMRGSPRACNNLSPDGSGRILNFPRGDISLVDLYFFKSFWSEKILSWSFSSHMWEWVFDGIERNVIDWRPQSRHLLQKTVLHGLSVTYQETQIVTLIAVLDGVEDL
jgi:hypothetical protein